jgi:hypothetical protein
VLPAACVRLERRGAAGQRKEILCMGSILSTQNSNALPSYGFCNFATSGSTVVGDNFACEARAGRERPVECDAEPAAECLGIAHGSPHAYDRRPQHNLFLDAISIHRSFLASGPALRSK